MKNGNNLKYSIKLVGDIIIDLNELESIKILYKNEELHFDSTDLIHLFEKLQTEKVKEKK